MSGDELLALWSAVSGRMNNVYLSAGLHPVDKSGMQWRQSLSTHRVRKHAHVGTTGEAALAEYQPDILAEGLDVVFCGINPATSAVAEGHSFSNGSNRFWTVLHLAGFTDRRLQPHEGGQLLVFGCGITTVINRPTRRADEIASGAFAVARPAFEAKIHQFAPRSIAFLGKRAISAMLGQSDLPWGRLLGGFAGTTAWVLPNPSGRNRAFALDALVRSYAELHRALRSGSG
jgi:TDG/mug DNA glycosylase family protein